MTQDPKPIANLSMVRQFIEILSNEPLGYSNEAEHIKLEDFVRRCLRKVCAELLPPIPAEQPERGTERMTRFAYVPMGATFRIGPLGTVDFIKVGEDHAIADGYKYTLDLGDKCRIITASDESRIQPLMKDDDEVGHIRKHLTEIAIACGKRKGHDRPDINDLYSAAISIIYSMFSAVPVSKPSPEIEELMKAARESLAVTDCEGECEQSVPETCAHNRLKKLLDHMEGKVSET